ATGSPYYSTEVTLDANLSNTKWTSSTGTFTNYNSSGAGSGKSIAISSASADTAYLTLSFDVENGYELDITSYSFAHRSSTTGYTNYKLVVNGIEIGNGSIFISSSGSSLQSTGVVNAINSVSGQMGAVNVVLKLFGGSHGHSGTFRMDDFVLNGFVREENSGHSSSDYFVSRNHRYSFQNQEKHDEVRGKGNYINYKYRGYDPRVGRLDWLIDPLSGDYPYYSPYAFSGNRVLDAVELEGLEPASMHLILVNDAGEVEYDNILEASGAEHLGAYYLENMFPNMGLKSKDFALNSHVTIKFNTDAQKIEGLAESASAYVYGNKKQSQPREFSNWERNGPFGIILGEANADKLRNWESDNLSGRAPLPLRLLVKVLPGPALVDAGFTLVTGNDMMSPARGEVNGLGYASSATTVGTGVHDLLGGTKKIAKFAGRFNVFLGVGIELFETYKEGGFDRVNNIEDDKEN
ncbi:MAG TPA: hypothetical protein VFD78_00700, partial [Chitinophagaceae bacterium]|nr:hypothetical protein [Chitinophagaceae bacterium]